MGRATGWLGRAQPLLEGEERHVEHGYLLLLVVLHHEATGDHEAASATGAAAGEIGKRFGGADLFCSRYRLIRSPIS